MIFVIERQSQFLFIFLQQNHVMKIFYCLQKSISLGVFIGLSLFTFLGANDRFIPVFFQQTHPFAVQNAQIQASSFTLYTLNFEQLNLALNGEDIPHRNDAQTENQVFISLPQPNGGLLIFKVLKNTTMHPILKQAYPEIRTFDVVAKNNNSIKGKIDITPHGFHAMIFDDRNGTYFIDPIEKGNNALHILYKKQDFITDKVMSCSHQEDAPAYISDILESEVEMPLSYASCALRTYRLALAATGEYTIYHGGTVALALAAQVTTMNRVNGVYEREIAITMEIIPDNNLIIYTNPATDPYTNGNASTMLGQNQTTLGTVIGAANYDIGHVFGTNSGGVAGLGVVCNSNNNNKARGVTGSSNPIGDPFDIDYVAHEMGHQFAANHTQNNPCNSVNAARFEPGSASTIMGYAGICAPNVQSNSDDYFHSRSLQEMGTFISGTNHTCPVITNLPNQAPTITATNGAVTLPISTPFALTANATDPNAGDVLWYRWEQYNNQASTQPPSPNSTGGPNFRTFVSSTNPTRYFPSLQALANNGPFTWEVLPAVSRTMNFRCTVHDDHVVGGCSDYVQTSVTFDASAGPFVLTYPSISGITWPATTQQTVTWNVANTDNTTVNCQMVDIFLSVDGGVNYSNTLASGVPNTGSFVVTVPNLPNTTSRIMVMAENGTFFDVSDNNFTITEAVGYDLNVPVSLASACADTSATYTILIDQLGGYTSPVVLNTTGLPAGASSSWSLNPVSTPGSATLTIQTQGLLPGDYPFEVLSSSASGDQSINLVLQILPNPEVGFALVGQELMADFTFADSYQWLDCSSGSSTPIAGANNFIYPLTSATGQYALQLSLNGCYNVSECLLIDMSNIPTNHNLDFAVYPNPSDGKFTLTWLGDINQQNHKITLFDATGRFVLAQTITENNYILDLSAYCAGVYFLELKSESENHFIRLIKN